MCQVYKFSFYVLDYSDTSDGSDIAEAIEDVVADFDCPMSDFAIEYSNRYDKFADYIDDYDEPFYS